MLKLIPRLAKCSTLIYLVMKHTEAVRRQYRAFDNLPTKHLGYGRHVSGFVTPFRYWMWRQNELWRNVHEAQFEHLRRVYRRQWFESYRVNADEYIHKYNITKAATLAQWETEMHQQDAHRLEKLREHRALGKLKEKQRDLYREAHERQFFQWYERASERLQAMRKIPYIPRSEVAAHIDAELNKYVAGQEGNYPLNFVGQIPVLEDEDGNIVEVPAHMISTHRAERPESTATEYAAPKASSADEHLLGLVSNDAHFLFEEGKSSLEQQVLEDIAKEEDELRSAMERSSAVSEKSRDEMEAERRAYIERGKVGVKTGGWKKSGRTVVPAKADSASSTGVSAGRKPARPTTPKVDRKQLVEAAKDRTRAKLDGALESKYASQRLSSSGEAGPHVGEVAAAVPKIRSRLKLPSMEEVMANPVMASQMGGSSVANTQNASKPKH